MESLTVWATVPSANIAMLATVFLSTIIEGSAKTRRQALKGTCPQVCSVVGYTPLCCMQAL